MAHAGIAEIPELSLDDRLETWTNRVNGVLPDADPRDRAYLAYKLALEDLLRAGGIGQISDLGVLHVHAKLLDAWRDDADGDGVLSEAEVEAAMNSRANYSGEAAAALGATVVSPLPYAADGPVDPASLQLSAERPDPPPPHLLATADLDGDGALSDEEWRRAAADAINEATARERFMIERLAGHALDANGDGSFGPEERRALEARLSWLKDVGVTLDTAWISPVLLSSLRESIPELNWSRPWETAPGFDPDPPLPELVVREDVNGDGVLDFIDALGSQEAVNAYFAERARRAIQSRYRGVLAALDDNRDGAISDSEWQAGHDRLPALEARQRFNYFYDTDRDGVIADGEITQFMNWYDAGGIRADADFNGRVEAADIRAFVEAIQQAP